MKLLYHLVPVAGAENVYLPTSLEGFLLQMVHVRC